MKNSQKIKKNKKKCRKIKEEDKNLTNKKFAPINLF